MQHVAEALNTKGWITQTDAQLNSSGIRALGKDETPLRQAGYTGAKPEVYGEYFNDRSNEHVIYNPDIISHEKAVEELRNWVRNTPP